jgi:creatinine amidohydrolase
MTKSYLWMDMTWPELQKAAKQKRILLFVVGAVEQHGLALPTSVDVLLPMAIAERVAKQINGVVAPCMNYGYKSLFRVGGGPNFPGSIGLKGKTVISVVSDVMSQFFQQGWRRIVVLDWHFENVPFVHEGIDEALSIAGKIPGLKVVIINDPNSLGLKDEPGLQDDLFGIDFPGWFVEHAAIWETSAMMAAFPDKVQTGKIVDGHPPEPIDYDVLPAPLNGAPESGVFWKATQSSPEKGERILASVCSGIIKVINKEFGI